MAQVLEFRLPDLGEGLTEAEIVRWLVSVGDVVAVDQPVVEVETAKAMVEVPCPYGGVVTARFGEEGTELPVGAPLLTVAVGAVDGGPGGGPVPDAEAREPGGGHRAAGSRTSGAAPPGGAADSAGAAGGASGETSGNVLVGYGTGAPAARRRRVGPRSVRPAAGTPVLREPGVVTPEPAAVQEPVPEGPVPVISPLVRKLARQGGVDLRQLTGSGPEGLILRADVERAVQAAAAPVAPAVPGTASEPVPAPAAAAEPAGRTGQAAGQAAGQEIRIPLRGVRGAVADKLSRSRSEIPDATCWVDADATELMAARTAMNAAGAPKISLLALLARICTAALARHPELNSRVDTERREVVLLPEVHLGFAAQTERGLVVPVVRAAHRRTAESLTEEFARLTDAARRSALTPAELTGGTFTLNNYGVFGVDGSTPIVNHPEAAMLGVGRIVPKPWVHRGELAVRQVVQLSLTFDHRVCDGGTAGGFLRYVADCVEQPALLLRTL
ncbi:MULTISPECIES: dihydrolipoamide acetyltransferase family protein [Streptomyces]|uniref:Dihydrolipoamide acetyltransferase component of pyruvate dehydrogenase complex n=1 Tax=Streptomyces tsukubensis (strain DSM 42081 / NBRC 108919 / NRRL 18488 / 9993) TaxID=1114943 RepID=A0A7G3UMW0_STRT9|nr:MULTISPECIES: dihydrolipoamide acetyltransferase family protein [Streptomyces]AZK98487.1 branched-chain alpha-keto acid dehydrogenase subunit E2 [Streptomyces tsukubensis]MYS62901.1 2-oxo acid dehydrogenase subunit E2 [Streptomyces sp. SID5473]QKM71674.1 2-oxo acid dehydrogenase subunit E2 [Streptomyces tsukubensis NRRL18488]TAI43499.1 2-oxo acid dehydrogenase subunit E2 [Streptomyces tsukubensis]